MLKSLAVIAIAVLGTAVLVPGSLEAQDVRYTEVSKGEFGGALGRMMKVVPGGSKETKETTSIKGLRLRTDDDETSTIIDLEEKQFTFLDHEGKTYFSMSLAEMAAAAQQMAEQLADTLEAARAEAETQRPEGEPEVEWEVHFSTDRTGKRQKILGYQAEQVFFTLEVRAKEIPQESDKEEKEEEEYDRGGTLVFLTDLWLSQEFPAWRAMMEHGEAWAESFGAEEPSAGMQQAFTFDPRIKEGIERMTEEMKGLEGTPLRTVTHVVTVPYGMQFDRKAVLKDADRSLGDDMADAASDAAKESAKDAIGGITGGLFGRKKKEPEKPKPKQVTFMRVKSEVTDVDTAPLAESVFAIPAGYTERESMFPVLPAR